MERKSGIVALAIFFIAGCLLSVILVTGGAVFRYWSERSDQLLVVLGIVVAALVVAAVIRRRWQGRRRHERFVAATQAAATGLVTSGELSGIGSMEARRAAGRSATNPNRPLPPPSAATGSTTPPPPPASALPRSGEPRPEV